MLNEKLEFDADGVLYWKAPSQNKYALPSEYKELSLIEVLQRLTREDKLGTRNMILKELGIF